MNMSGENDVGCYFSRSLFDINPLLHLRVESKQDEWWGVQDSNLRPPD